MSKAKAFLLTAFGVLALTGAGCAGDIGEDVNTNEENENAVSSSTAEVDTGILPSEEPATIEATAEALGNGLVSVKWTVDGDFDKTKSFQVLHSSKPNPDHPSAFWFQYMNNARSTELSNVPAGKRFFRVCSFDLAKNECVAFSNEIELEVK